MAASRAASTPTTSPRTLADQFRSWSDEQLGALVEARPDLAAPAPQDSAQLASRAGTRASVVRAVDQLDVLGLTVLDAVNALGGAASPVEIRAVVHAEPAQVDATLARLRALALLWGGEDRLRVVSMVGEVVGTTISGLGPSAAALLASHGPGRVTALARELGEQVTGEPTTDAAAVAEQLRDPAGVAALVDEVDDPAREILTRLERDGTEGRVESTERSASRASSTSPVDQLLARGLLVARDRRHVTVPREVAMALRDGRTTRAPMGQQPELATAERDQRLVDQAAAGAAFELVRHVELLLEHWSTAPPAALRTGGLAVRDLKAVAELLHTSEPAAALHVEVAAAAGLLAVGDTEDTDAAWMPTDQYDLWSARSVSDRWTALALAWLDSPRLMGLVGGRDEQRRTVNALAPDLERGWVPDTRRTVLDVLGDLPTGEVLAAGTGVASVVALVRWLRPRRPAQRAEAVGWTLEESAVLGITALGGLCAHGRLLVTADDPRHEAAAALEPLLPEPVDHVLLQADLTAVAPGPLEQELARQLALLADIESRGGATVYRFTATSVRRAFDAGWSAGEVHEMIAAASRTPVPQPLVYLVDDVARRFGTLRVGTAESFLRSDDESALAELVHHPKASALRLRRIAPTVVVSDAPVDVLLARLRELGSAPVVEAPDGTVRLARQDLHRARTPRHRPASPTAPGDDTAHDPRALARRAARVTATVGAIRAGDRAEASRPRDSARGLADSPTSTMAALREAVETGTTVWIGYLDNHGSTVERVVDPLTVEAGWLSAHDHRSDEVRSFAIHRITAVSPAPR